MNDFKILIRTQTMTHAFHQKGKAAKDIFNDLLELLYAEGNFLMIDADGGVVGIVKSQIDSIQVLPNFPVKVPGYRPTPDNQYQ